jgi:hypothetical protein
MYVNFLTFAQWLISLLPFNYKVTFLIGVFLGFSTTISILVSCFKRKTNFLFFSVPFLFLGILYNPKNLLPFQDMNQLNIEKFNKIIPELYQFELKVSMDFQKGSQQIPVNISKVYHQYINKYRLMCLK